MADKLHRLLERQISRSGLNLLDTPEGKAFIENINNAYLQFTNEFSILEESTALMLRKISLTNENLNVLIDSLDGFNYHVSHDLKNTLINTRSLSNMARKYLEKNDIQKVEEVISKLALTSDSGLELMEKFLQMSKFESSLMGQKIEPVNIEKLILDNVNQLKLHHDFDFRFIEKQFNILDCKDFGISSLIQNLLTNAIKYAHTDHKLEIELSLIKSNSFKILQFKDNGIGIDLVEHGDKLFKPFVRIANNLNQEGTGVGLFIVKKVVIEHGGTIKVNSKPNFGTEFIITF